MEEKKKNFMDKLEDAEVVLVGIGEEFGETVEETSIQLDFEKFLEKISQQKNLAWLPPYIRMLKIKYSKAEQTMKAYGILEKLLENKDYFIVSTRKDDRIYDSGLRSDRIVTPCGGYRLTQCMHGCQSQVYRVNQVLLKEIEECLKGIRQPDTLYCPRCPVCGEPLIFNNIEAEAYVEAGYQKQWENYTSWLQRTLNRRLCVLELGVGMSYPTVIRWPFERIVFLNQKSNLVRVHSKLYQLTEEIQERGYKINENPLDFLINRFV